MDKLSFSITFVETTPESVETGEFANSGFDDENLEFDEFRDLVRYVELSGFCYASQSPLPKQPCEDVWFSNEMSTVDYATALERQESIHPNNERSARYLFKAMQGKIV